MLAVSDDLFISREDDQGAYLEIEWSKPQYRFLQSAETYPLFVGGFGSGKSTTMAGAMFRDLTEFPGANIGGYAPTYDLLKLITIPNLLDFLDGAGLRYDYNKSWYTIEVDGYGMFILRSLDTPRRIVGYETFRGHIDEIDTLPKDKAREAWNKVIARSRQRIVRDGVVQKNKVSAYTTPEGYSFCYDRWCKNPAPGYALYKAPTYSNRHLPPDYIDNLRDTYPDELIDAYIEGEFVNLTSGAVYRHFDRALNATTEIEAPREMLHVGMDFNVLYGAAVVCVIRDGDPIAVGEIHSAYDTDDQIAILKERYPDHPICVYPDSSGDNRSSSNTALTDIKKLKVAGFKVKAQKQNPRIKDRVASMNAVIKTAAGVRRLKVNTERCPELTAALEQQVYGANGQPDKAAGLDHICDALGYFISAVFGIIKPRVVGGAVRGAY